MLSIKRPSGHALGALWFKRYSIEILDRVRWAKDTWKCAHKASENYFFLIASEKFHKLCALGIEPACKACIQFIYLAP